MLDVMVPVMWREEADGSATGTPLCAPPEALIDLAGQPDSEPLRLASARHPADGVRLRLGWVYGDQGVIALDAPVDYLHGDGRFRLRAADRAEVGARWREAAGEAPIPVTAAEGGCGGTLAMHLLGPGLRAELANGESGVTDQRSRFFSRAARLPDRLAALPGALAFHTDRLPEPITLTVEATTACNFDCVFCYGRHIERGVLRWEQFLAMLDHLPALTAVEFTGEGEPMINRRLPDMIRECKRRGLWVHLTTNGSRLNRARAEMLLDLGIDALAFSLESIEPELFAQIRPGGVLDELKSGIRTFAEARHARGADTKMLLWVSVLRRTLCEIDRILAFAEEAGFDRVELQTLNSLAAYRRFYGPVLESDILSCEEVAAAAEVPERSPAARDALRQFVRIFDSSRCDIFMGSVMAYWSGAVTPCRLLKVPQHPEAGNLFRTPFAELWSEAGFRRFRFALQHGAVLNSCDGCAYVHAA
ncbi:MAG: radical SAM protein [Sphingomonas sp.]